MRRLMGMKLIVGILTFSLARVRPPQRKTKVGVAKSRVNLEPHR